MVWLIYSCCWLQLLPQLGCNIPTTTYKYFGPSQYFLPWKPELTIHGTVTARRRGFWKVSKTRRLFYFFEMTLRWPYLIFLPQRLPYNLDLERAAEIKVRALPHWDSLPFSVYMKVQSTLLLKAIRWQESDLSKIIPHFWGVPQCPDSGHWGT